MITPCPICNWFAGFHDDRIHAEARAAIPAELFKEKGWHTQKEEKVDE